MPKTEFKQKPSLSILNFYFCINFTEAKQAERLDIEEKYNSLQEEAAGKTKKLKKVWTMFNTTKSELEDMQQVCILRLVCLHIESFTGLSNGFIESVA